MLLTDAFVILIGWAIFVFGFVIKKDYAITSLASIYLMVLGTDMIANGTGVSPTITLALGSIHIAIGFYVLVVGGTKTYVDKELTLEPIKQIINKMKGRKKKNANTKKD